MIGFQDPDLAGFSIATIGGETAVRQDEVDSHRSLDRLAILGCRRETFPMTGRHEGAGKQLGLHKNRSGPFRWWQALQGIPTGPFIHGFDEWTRPVGGVKGDQRESSGEDSLDDVRGDGWLDLHLAHMAPPDEDVGLVECRQSLPGIVERGGDDLETGNRPEMLGYLVPQPIRVGLPLLGLPFIPDKDPDRLSCASGFTRKPGDGQEEEEELQQKEGTGGGHGR